VPREEEGKGCGILRLERRENKEEYSRKKNRKEDI
jgi:hypothetical protein